MPTPFRKNGDLDEQALKELITYYDGTKLNGLLVMGTAGEFAMMSEGERRRVAEIAVGTAEKLEIILNVGWASTRESIKLAKFARDIGADCVIAVEPYFYHPTAEGIARHYFQIAEQADMPVMAYNIPSFAGNKIPPEALDLFSKDERIVGIKDSEGDAARLQEFIDRAPCDFSVMVGMDSLVSYGVCQGAKGMMIGSAAIAPDICIDMYRSLMEGKYEQAYLEQKKLNDYIRAMQVGTFPAALKHMLALRGLPGGHVRAPLEDLNEEQKRMVQYHLRTAKMEVCKRERIIR